MLETNIQQARVYVTEYCCVMCKEGLSYTLSCDSRIINGPVYLPS